MLSCGVFKVTARATELTVTLALVMLGQLRVCPPHITSHENIPCVFIQSLYFLWTAFFSHKHLRGNVATRLHQYRTNVVCFITT